MKSTQKDNIVRTSCKNCIFAVYEDKKQIDCQAKRVHKIEDKFEAYDDEKEFYVLERLCNYYREDKEKYLKYGIMNTQLVRDEAKVNFVIFCLFDKIDEEKAKNFENTISTIVSKYGKNKVEIHICHKDFKERNIVQKLVSSLDARATCYFDKKFLQKIIMKTKKSFHVILDESNFDKISIIFDVNSLINEDMKKLTVIKKDNAIAVSNLAYKITAINKECNNYEQIIEYVMKESKKRDLYQEAV
jgi:hypothetical protein